MSGRPRMGRWSAICCARLLMPGGPFAFLVLGGQHLRAPRADRDRLSRRGDRQLQFRLHSSGRAGVYRRGRNPRSRPHPDRRGRAARRGVAQARRLRLGLYRRTEPQAAAGKSRGGERCGNVGTRFGQGTICASTAGTWIGSLYSKRLACLAWFCRNLNWQKTLPAADSKG